MFFCFRQTGKRLPLAEPTMFSWIDSLKSYEFIVFHCVALCFIVNSEVNWGGPDSSAWQGQARRAQWPLGPQHVQRKASQCLAVPSCNPSASARQMIREPQRRKPRLVASPKTEWRCFMLCSLGFFGFSFAISSSSCLLLLQSCGFGWLPAWDSVLCWLCRCNPSWLQLSWMLNCYSYICHSFSTFCVSSDSASSELSHRPTSSADAWYLQRLDRARHLRPWHWGGDTRDLHSMRTLEWTGLAHHLYRRWVWALWPIRLLQRHFKGSGLPSASLAEATSTPSDS